MNQEISNFVTERIELRSRDFGRQVRATAQNLQTIAQQLRSDDLTQPAAQLADRGARLIDSVGTYFERSDLDAILSDAEQYGREHPWTLGLVGLSAGIAFSRLIKSTTARRNASGPQPQSWTGGSPSRAEAVESESARAALGNGSQPRSTVPRNLGSPSVATGEPAAFSGAPEPSDAI